jgi:hypothetical protein
MGQLAGRAVLPLDAIGILEYFIRPRAIEEYQWAIAKEARKVCFFYSRVAWEKLASAVLEPLEVGRLLGLFRFRHLQVSS